MRDFWCVVCVVSGLFSFGFYFVFIFIVRIVCLSIFMIILLSLVLKKGVKLFIWWSMCVLCVIRLLMCLSFFCSLLRIGLLSFFLICFLWIYWMWNFWWGVRKFVVCVYVMVIDWMWFFGVKNVGMGFVRIVLRFIVECVCLWII